MTTATAARIIARARESWTNSPETDGGAEAFDRHIGIVGIQPYGELYQEVYALANEGHQVVVGGSEAHLSERKERAAHLWRTVLPELEAFAAQCRSTPRTGWSR